VDPAVAKGLAERFRYVILAFDVSKRGRPVSPVQREPRWWPAGRGLVLRGGRPRPLPSPHPRRAGKGSAPPHTRQGPRTLAAFRPWGSWRGSAVRGVLRQSSSGPDAAVP